MVNIGNKVKKLREYKNLTQEHIAHGLGISQQAYSRLETDSSALSIAQLFKVSELLEVSPSMLLEEEAHQIIYNLNSNNNNKGHISNGTHLPSTQEKHLYEQLIAQQKEEIATLKTQNSFLQKLWDVDSHK